MSFSPLMVNRFDVAGMPLTVKFPYPPVPLTMTPGGRVRNVGDVATSARQLRDFPPRCTRLLMLGSVLMRGAVPETSTVSVPLATDSAMSTFEVLPT